MKIVTCIAATTSDEFNNSDIYTKNDVFSLDNLIKMQEDVFNRYIPVIQNFDNDKIVGMVESAEITTKGLKITAKLQEMIEPAYIVPGFRITDAEYEEEIDKFIYKDLELQYMGITNTPSEKNVTKFEER